MASNTLLGLANLRYVRRKCMIYAGSEYSIMNVDIFEERDKNTPSPLTAKNRSLSSSSSNVAHFCVSRLDSKVMWPIYKESQKYSRFFFFVLWYMFGHIVAVVMLVVCWWRWIRIIRVQVPEIHRTLSRVRRRSFAVAFGFLVLR